MYEEDILEELLKKGSLTSQAIYKYYGEAEEVDEVLARMQRQGHIKKESTGKWELTRKGLSELKKSGYGKREEWADLAIEMWRDE